MAYDPSDIFSQTDIIKLIKSKTINKDIIIRGEHLTILNGLEKINGSLGVSDSNLESLGELKEITGDLWISSHTVFSRLRSLGKLEYVGGDLNLRYSNVIDLGALKKVDGRFSLRDTAIKDINNLTFVGENLFLPKRLQNKLDLSKVTINGKVRYWKDSKTTKDIIPKEELSLVIYPNGVPNWQHKYVYSVKDIENANYEQIEFYKIYKLKFKEGIFLDLEGNDNYSFILYYDLLSENSLPKRMKDLQEHFINLERFYPKTKNYTRTAIIEKMESHKDYEAAWKLIYKGKNIRIQNIIQYEQKLKRSLIDSELMIKLGGISHLTEFGQSNIENIKPFANKRLEAYEIEKGIKFFELFFQNGKEYQTSEKVINSKIKMVFEFLKKIKKESTSTKYDSKYYKQFFLNKSEYYHYKSIDDSQIHLTNRSAITHVVEKAIFNQCRLILKQAEDLYRESIGMPKIGEGWISETELFYKISNHFKEYEVIHHGSPDWIDRQHLDIYLPKVNIGIEYQGAQHYVPIEFFGGQEAFEKTKDRDENKRLKCIENGCSLIYVNEGYNFEDVRKKITEIIKKNGQ